MEEHTYAMPIEEAVKIQEALKPLGYVVHKYSDGYYTEGVELILSRNGKSALSMDGISEKLT